MAAHRRIDRLVAQLETEVDLEEGRRIARELLTLLAPHMAAEEQILFPKIQERAEEEEDRVMLMEASLDHGQIWDLATRLLDTEIDLDEMKASTRAMNKLLASHIEEEENDILFIASKVLTYAQFSDTARALQDRQEELLKEASDRAAEGDHRVIQDLYRTLGGPEKRTRHPARPSHRPSA